MEAEDGRVGGVAQVQTIAAYCRTVHLKLSTYCTRVLVLSLYSVRSHVL